MNLKRWGMRFRAALCSFALLAFAASGAAAQGFGVMESAETIQRGNFKLVGYPMIVLGEGDLDNEVGLVLRGGYGFTDRFDAEIGVGLYDDVTFLGANAELWLLRAPRGTTGLNFSARGGAYLVQSDGEDGTGLNLAGILSTRFTPQLEFVGALDYNQLFYDGPIGDISTLHIVPGFEYRVTRNLDFLGEFGVALSDDASHYLAVGLAYYLR